MLGNPLGFEVDGGLVFQECCLCTESRYGEGKGGKRKITGTKEELSSHIFSVYLFAGQISLVVWEIISRKHALPSS